jgi:hypothetical protein
MVEEILVFQKLIANVRTILFISPSGKYPFSLADFYIRIAGWAPKQLFPPRVSECVSQSFYCTFDWREILNNPGSDKVLLK